MSLSEFININDVKYDDIKEYTFIIISIIIILLIIINFIVFMSKRYILILDTPNIKPKYIPYYKYTPESLILYIESPIPEVNDNLQCSFILNCVQFSI